MEITVCPSCTGKIDPLKNGKFFCESCDCIFRITREGPRVEKVGPLMDLAGRVDRIEETLGESASVQDPKPAADEPPSQQPAEDPDGDEIDDVAEDVNQLWDE